MIVVGQRPRRAGVEDDVHEVDVTEDDAALEGFCRKDEIVFLSPPVELTTLCRAPGVDPEATAVRRRPSPVLNILDPGQDGRGEWLPNRQDVVVVSPYNAHVRCLRQAIPDQRIRIGTLDKFQGQQAAVVFYSMASSSSEDVPRGLDFLFSRNRLNVAMSRAKCLAYLVASPRLLDANCRTIEQMRLANALCRLVEDADTPLADITSLS